MKGYVNFTLATSPYQGWGEVGKTECRYRAFRDHEGSFTPSHYKILGLKLAFVIIFEVSTIERLFYAKFMQKMPDVAVLGIFKVVSEFLNSWMYFFKVFFC